MIGWGAFPCEMPREDAQPLPRTVLVLKQRCSRPITGAVPSTQTVLLQCLDAAGYDAGGVERWVSARAVARRLSPTANATAVAEDLARLHRVGLVEMWFKGGNTYYRNAR